MLCLRDAEVVTFLQEPHIPAWYPLNPLDVSNYSSFLNHRNPLHLSSHGKWGHPESFWVSPEDREIHSQHDRETGLISPHSVIPVGSPLEPPQLWKSTKYYVCGLKNEFLQQSRNRWFVKNNKIISYFQIIMKRARDSFFLKGLIPISALVITVRWMLHWYLF